MLSVLLLFINVSFAVTPVSPSKTSITVKDKAAFDMSVCQGTFSAVSTYQELGIDIKPLSAGLPCYTADFDNNGFVDYWFNQAHSKIVLMEKGEPKSIVKVGMILDASTIFLVKEQNKFNWMKRLGCKLPAQDGIINMGDGEGQINRIYVLDKVKGAFIEFSQCETIEGL